VTQVTPIQKRKQSISVADYSSERNEGTRWSVTIQKKDQTKTVEEFDSVMVCTGYEISLIEYLFDL
jgi:cation diffusion facilitator CzcD-associated flavoprotein CzcO